MILPDLITPHAETSPDKAAYYFRGQALTFSQLNQQILRCAGGLSDLGIKKGDTMGILLRNCPEFVIFSMALSKLGAVVVPINFLEKPERVSLILNDSKAVGILSAREFFPTVKNAAKTIKSLKHIFLRDHSEGKAKPFSDLLKAKPWEGKTKVSDDDLMMLLYTSGTTGRPKGVMLTHRNFIANVDQCMAAIKLKTTDKFLCLLPMFHSFSWTTCVLIPLKLGVPVVVIETLLPFDPVIHAIWEYKTTLFVGVPQIFGALASKIKGPKAFFIRLLNPVRICISGAAPLPKTIHTMFEKNLGVPLLEGYGLTEAAPVVCLNPESKRKVGTVGKSLPGITLEFRDEAGKPVSASEVGEIWIKGDNVMKGYYGKKAETAEVLTKDGWLKTGDMGRFDEEGYVVIVDRKKDLIIVKGLNVYPQEVENVISALKFVKEVAVIGKMDEESGDEIIRAFIVPKEGMEVDKEAVHNACREHLAPYKRPRDVVSIRELPKNALQKVLKKDLRKL